MNFAFHRIEILALVGGAGLIGIIFELVRRRKIKERYSLLWFCTGLTVLGLALNRNGLERFSALIGVYYAPSSIFLVLSGFMILILIHFSTVISQLLSQNQQLGQKLALLEAEFESLTRSDFPRKERTTAALKLVDSRKDR
jgi:hypothetical protein